ncbi:hypothetical protein E2C01_047869 [Portunus trituberculatus]|uniref:Uncharacterized protein n=1 Tax=Portunus trituberculatus TaxID=210409 RepID=A0A5B7GBP8_PORTR|nr:hypothetical protein [Portunus trituberculatus]
MDLTFLFCNAGPSSESPRSSKPTSTKQCHLSLGYETWLPSHLSFTIPGYNITRKDRTQERGGGVLLAIRNTLVHTHLTLPPWQGGHLEVAAARVGLQRCWLTVAVFYNPGGASST